MRKQPVTLEISEEFNKRITDPVFIKESIERVIVPILVNNYLQESEGLDEKGKLREVEKLRGTSSLPAEPHDSPRPYKTIGEAAEYLRVPRGRSR